MKFHRMITKIRRDLTVENMEEKQAAFMSNDVVRQIVNAPRKERRRLVKENRALLESLRFADKIVVGGKVIMR